MKKICYIFIFVILSLVLADFHLWPQGKAITQGEVAKLIGEGIGFREDEMTKLKQIGVTPLGEWNPEKSMTKEDLDAVLIRIARRDPVRENIEPIKLVDSMGFPPRDVSQEGIRRLIETDAFRKIAINLRLLLSASILPLPRKYIREVGAIKEEARAGVGVAAPLGAASIIGVAPPIVVAPPIAAPPGPPPGPPVDPFDPVVTPPSQDQPETTKPKRDCRWPEPWSRDENGNPIYLSEFED